MKISIVLLLFIMFSNVSFAACCYATCIPNIQTENAKTQSKINAAFAKLMVSLGNLTKEYTDYLSVYNEQQRLLEKLQSLKAYNSKKLDEVNFLLETTNALLDVKIQEAGEKSE